jgi:hypothetical protein
MARDIIKNATLNNNAAVMEVIYPVNGTLTVQLVSGAGTVVAEGSIDGTTWFTLAMFAPDDETTTFASLGAAGVGVANVYGYEQVRVRETGGAATVVNIGLAYG